jgi:phosphoribosylpyrophosphate synthetase
MNTFKIKSNTYLSKTIDGFYHTDYLGYNKPGNPMYLNRLKNDRHHQTENELKTDAKMVTNILITELPKVFKKKKLERPVVCLIPRAKSSSSYTSDQLLFSKAVSEAVDATNGLKNGTNWINRMKPTQTTHLRYSTCYYDEGVSPYVGITKDTCIINPKVKGRNIILVDDIYTIDVNIIEDTLQALLEAGAKSVTSYVVAKTKKH